VPVGKASWWRRHPMLASLASIVGVIALVGGAVALGRWATKPELECGPGMVTNASSSACIGVNLAEGRISLDQPDRLGELVADVKDSNDAVSGTNYEAFRKLIS
jgi:hypothetical protein